MNHVAQSSPGLGHNNPPDPLEEAFRPIQARTNELRVGLARVPETIDPDNEGRVTDFIKQVKATIKDAKDAHRAVKAPVLEQSRAIDAKLKAMTEPLEKMLEPIQKRLADYAKKCADEERRRQEEARRRAAEEEEAKRREAEEARRAAEEKARSADTVEARQEAEAAFAGVQQAEAEAEAAAKKRELADKAKSSLIRGESGSVAVQQTYWAHEIDMDTFDLNRLRPFFKPEEIDKAVRAAIKAKGGDPGWKGLTVWRDTRIAVR